MADARHKCIRFEEDPEMAIFTSPRGTCMSKFTNRESTSEQCSDKFPNDAKAKTFHKRVLTRVFSEEFEFADKMLLDPRGSFIKRWNKIFLAACLVSLFVDPLFFYLPEAKRDVCIGVSEPLEITLTVIRSLADFFYFVRIFVRFRTAYVAPSSRVIGRGELVVDPSKISSRYLKKDFWLDLLAAQPIPQMLVWAVIPYLKGSSLVNTKLVLRLIIIFQYILRLYLIFPLSSQIIKASGILLETAWAGAAYNLMLYMLASHVLGACWYLLSIERQQVCWKEVCESHLECNIDFFSCRFLKKPSRVNWFQSSNVSILCDPNSNYFQFGIYADAVTSGVTSYRFWDTYFYCLWWGLRNLSSLGQNLSTSTYFSEIIFAITIAIIGLVLFGLLIGNMQRYLQSTTARLEEWRIRRTDTKLWMRHRQLPHDLKQSVRKYDQYKWVATRGVDEESILESLPMDLRRNIKLHLCLDLVRQVPFFDLMDDRMLVAICERLKPHLCTPGTCLVREEDPVNEMIFIVRGHLDSYTTDGGRKGFFNSCRLGPGDFCGEEMLTWVLDPRPSIILPTSTRTVKAITEVEAFAFIAEDLKFVATQYKKLHSKQLRHAFRCHSPQWRTWAACFIQAAWFRYRRRKERAEMKKNESKTYVSEQENEQTEAYLASVVSSRFNSYAAKLAASIRRGRSQKYGTDFDIISSLQKPNEPDFSSCR